MNDRPNLTTIPQEQELDFLVDRYFSKQHTLEIFKRKAAEEKANLEREFAEAEQCLIDYMQGNGLAKDYTSDKKHGVTLAVSRSTEITCDVNELPERFVRTKKEPNKILINEAVKNGEQFNWLATSESLKLTVK